MVVRVLLLLSTFVPVDPKLPDFDWLTTGLFHLILPCARGHYDFSEVFKISSTGCTCGRRGRHHQLRTLTMRCITYKICLLCEDLCFSCLFSYSVVYLNITHVQSIKSRSIGLSCSCGLYYSFYLDINAHHITWLLALHTLLDLLDGCHKL